ncbi:MAG: peptidase S41, partial [Prevotella sp.]|nr:peptidase S41 [Prevotella sp.]
MKRFISYVIIAVAMAATVTSCVDEEEFDDSPTGNFEALWKIIDEHYCFFDYKKQEYGLDWDDVYAKYRVRISDNMTSDQLFEVMADMLSELRDGHVNLSRAADFARYWSWKEDYPSNFSDTLQRRYLGTDYQIASGITYRVLDDNIGYIY